MKMENENVTLRNQILATTRDDEQKEVYDRAFLELLVSHLLDQTNIYKDHDITLPIVGYASNFLVDAMPDYPGEYAVYFDVTIKREEYDWYRDRGLGGFSYAAPLATNITNLNDPNPVGGIFLPYPLYTDEERLDEIVKQSRVNIHSGKYIQKQAIPDEIIYIFIYIVYIFLNRETRDMIISSLKEMGDIIKKHFKDEPKPIGYDLPIKVKDNQFNLRIIQSIAGRTLTEDQFKDIERLLERIIKENKSPAAIRKVICIIDKNEAVLFERIEYANGDIRHLVGYESKKKHK